jgi:hypothetical protein
MVPRRRFKEIDQGTSNPDFSGLQIFPIPTGVARVAVRSSWSVGKVPKYGFVEILIHSSWCNIDRRG